MSTNAVVRVRPRPPLLPTSIRASQHSRRLPTPKCTRIDPCRHCGDSAAFTRGLLRPRVAVTTALVDQLHGDELEAVLADEHYYVTNFDPASSSLFARCRGVYVDDLAVSEARL
jgi:hypothetical protein